MVVEKKARAVSIEDVPNRERNGDRLNQRYRHEDQGRQNHQAHPGHPPLHGQPSCDCHDAAHRDGHEANHRTAMDATRQEWCREDQRGTGEEACLGQNSRAPAMPTGSERRREPGRPFFAAVPTGTGASENSFVDDEDVTRENHHVWRAPFADVGDRKGMNFDLAGHLPPEVDEFLAAIPVNPPALAMASTIVMLG